MWGMNNMEFKEILNRKIDYIEDLLNEYMPKESCEAWNLMSDFIKKVMA